MTVPSGANVLEVVSVGSVDRVGCVRCPTSSLPGPQSPPWRRGVRTVQSGQGDGRMVRQSEHNRGGIK